jgi:hypothetical protein
MELLPYQQQLQELYYGVLVNQLSITVQTDATYTVTTANAGGCTVYKVQAL